VFRWQRSPDELESFVRGRRSPGLGSARSGTISRQPHARTLFSHTVDIVSSDQHTVKLWFNGKVTYSPPVVDLAFEGFPIEGGRLDSDGGLLIATLVYRRHLHSIDVFGWPANGQSPPTHFERDGYDEISGSKNDFVFI
jgi:anti-sigma factor RsiW